MTKKYVGIRIAEEIEKKIEKLIEVKHEETGVKLTKTQIIEMLINEGIKKIEQK